MTSLALCLLLGVAPSARAADKPARTMDDLKQIALEKGQDGFVAAPIARDLGLGDRKVARKQVYFDQGVTPDGFEHDLNLIVDPEAQQAFEWTVVKETMTAAGKWVDGYTFLVDLKGNLLAAASGTGIVGKVKRTTVSTKAARPRFQKERNFWLNESAQYPWSK